MPKPLASIDVIHINLDGEAVVDTTILCEGEETKIEAVPGKFFNFHFY